MMFEGLLFLQTAWTGFYDLRPIDKLTAVFTICVPLGTLLYAYSRQITKKLRQKTEELQILQELSENRAQQIKTLQQALKKSDETIAALKYQRPESWLKQAAVEREDGNEERAIRLLRSGFESIREPLSASCMDLAAHHFSLVPDYGGRQVGEAERQARLATLFCPEDENAKGLLAEILAVKAESDYTSGNEQAFDTAWDEVDDFLAIGKHPEIEERVLGKDHPETLRTRNNIAIWTAETGDATGELALLKAVLPDRDRVLGKDHPDTQNTREQIAALQSRGNLLVPKLQLGNAVLEAPASGFQSSWSMKGKVSQAGTWEPALPAQKRTGE